MDRLEKFFDNSQITIRDFGDFLNSLSVSSLDDGDLITLGDSLLYFPTIIQKVTTHPNSNLYGLDVASYYAKVKGGFTTKLKAGQIKRIERIGKLSGMFAQEHKTLAKRRHEKYVSDGISLKEVKDVFNMGLGDVYDGRRFRNILEGVSLIFQCPEIIPTNARSCFGSKWFNVKQFHGNYQYGLKSADELKDDGRKKMFLEGVSNSILYLGNSL